MSPRTLPLATKRWQTIVEGWPTERRTKVLTYLGCRLAQHYGVSGGGDFWKPVPWEADLHEAGHILTFHPEEKKEWLEFLRGGYTLGRAISVMPKRRQVWNEADALALSSLVAKVFGLELPSRVVRDGYNNSHAVDQNITWSEWPVLVRKRENGMLVRAGAKRALNLFEDYFNDLRKARPRPSWGVEDFYVFAFSGSTPVYRKAKVSSICQVSLHPPLDGAKIAGEVFRALVEGAEIPADLST